MASKAFNLAREVSSLLWEISSFRKRLAASEPFAKKFRMANARYKAALTRQGELFGRPLPEEEPARQLAEGERNRQFAKVQKLADKNNSSFSQHGASTAFVGLFVTKVELLVQRLPLTPQWQAFHHEIRKLTPLIQQLGAWAPVQSNTSLDTLELRLGQMIELAKTEKQSDKSPLGCNINRLRKECGGRSINLLRKLGLPRR